MGREDSRSQCDGDAFSKPGVDADGVSDEERPIRALRSFRVVDRCARGLDLLRIESDAALLESPFEMFSKRCRRRAGETDQAVIHEGAARFQAGKVPGITAQASLGRSEIKDGRGCLAVGRFAEARRQDFEGDQSIALNGPDERSSNMTSRTVGPDHDPGLVVIAGGRCQMDSLFIALERLDAFSFEDPNAARAHFVEECGVEFLSSDYAKEWGPESDGCAAAMMEVNLMDRDARGSLFDLKMSEKSVGLRRDAAAAEFVAGKSGGIEYEDFLREPELAAGESQRRGGARRTAAYYDDVGSRGRNEDSPRRKDTSMFGGRLARADDRWFVAQERRRARPMPCVGCL